VVRLGGDGFSLGDVDLPLRSGAGSLNGGGRGMGHRPAMAFNSWWSCAMGSRRS
jgi:hypothetical protein